MLERVIRKYFKKEENMKRFLSILMVLAMVLAMTACGNTTEEPAPAATTTTTTTTTEPAPAATTETTTPAKEKVLIVRLAGEPPTLMPNTNSNDYAYSIAGNVYNQLVTLDANREIIPDLAYAWEASKDGLHVTFHLNDDVYWHDGEKFSSADVKYTFDYILANTTCLMNARFTGYFDSVDAPDDSTVVFNLIKPCANELIGRLGYYATFILPQHVFDNGQDWNDNAAANAPIGTGPFKYVSTEAGVSITLEKNENYFGEEAKIDRLVYSIIPDAATAVQALYNGEIDIMENVPATEVDSLLANDDYTMNLQTLPSPVYLIFNFNDEALQDLALRQAIARCVNRTEISQKAYSGIRPPETHFYPSVISWVTNGDDVAPDFDPAAAKKILEDAGYTADADGFYAHVTLDCYSSDSFPDVAKLFAASCKEAGIDVSVNASEYQAWSQKVTKDKDFQLTLMGGFQGPDVSALSGRIGTGGASNYGGYTNTKIDALLDLGMCEADSALRKPFYTEVQRIMSQELPIVPFVQYSTYTVQASYVVNTPIECAGKVSWNSYALTDITD